METKIVFSGDEVASRLFLKLHVSKYTLIKKIYFSLALIGLIVAIVTFITSPGYAYWRIAIIFSLIMPFFYISQRNSIVDKSINKRATYDQTMIFKDSMIFHRYANTEKVYEYSQIIRFVEVVDYIYLYVDDVHAMIIPKLQISKTEMDELINHLHKKIDDKKYKYYKIKK